MIKEEYQKSCGAIVYTTICGSPHFLIIQQTDGFFGFPKGHIEENETEEETALREVFEETHIQGEIIKGFKEKDYYEFIWDQSKHIYKEVVYFLMSYQNQTPQIQEEELLDIKLLPYEEALETLSFESSKRILEKAYRFLNK